MGKGSVQYAALPWRMTDGGLEILLITSSSGRWIIPKGWPMDGKAPHEAAAQEAWEEAGVRGEAGAQAMGAFHTDKVRKDGRVKRLEVQVFPLAVTEEAERWPEAEVRQRRWAPPAEAARLAGEPELAALLAGFRGSP
ncbi:MAG TPA: NUDIX hydrolase [Caulobacteraceae bacterium]|nr:NUDIX hydrolase [Caulobacteraceae bacterium]